MTRFLPGLCRLSGIAVMLILGDVLVTEAPVYGPAEDMGTHVTQRVKEERSPPRDAPKTPACRRAQAHDDGPSVSDMRWERRVERIAGRLPIGLAAGIGGRVAFAHDGATARVPASNQKLLLSLAIFARLGPDHRIPTRAAAHEVDGGTVVGDLWLIGRGDPTLTAAEPGYWGDLEATTLAALARRIKRSGVTRVDGSVMGATDFFAHDFAAPGWQPYVPGRYVRLPSSLSINGNNSVESRSERAAAAALTKQLERIGVRVSGTPGAGETSTALTPLAEVRARPLREIVAFMNRSSNNFFAEMLGKRLGASVFGPPGTIEKGARAIEVWVRAHGAQATAHDSSGLSYRNRISPRTVVDLLGVARSMPWGRDLRDGLPAPGEGTLGYRLHGIEVRAKTGSLFNGASALSGWVRSTRSGRWVEFSILGRGVPKMIEDRVVRIISLARVPAPVCDDPVSEREGPIYRRMLRMRT
jgi:serine-type D-Ala-D-Ala carboxypeptidase/endopeptidase (penicillin-binding protein 4)